MPQPALPGQIQGGWPSGKGRSSATAGKQKKAREGEQERRKGETRRAGEPKNQDATKEKGKKLEEVKEQRREERTNTLGKQRIRDWVWVAMGQIPVAFESCLKSSLQELFLIPAAAFPSFSNKKTKQAYTSQETYRVRTKKRKICLSKQVRIGTAVNFPQAGFVCV